MTSSSEGTVLRGTATDSAVSLPRPDLRQGDWTRFGGGNAVGDRITEGTLAALAGSAREAARAQGYAVGWADGRRRAEDEARAEAETIALENARAEERRRQEHASALAALRQAAEMLHEQASAVCTRIEDQATDLAWALARQLVGHELRSASGADVVRRVLTVLPDEPMVTVRLHPSEAASPAVDDLTDRGVTICADPTLEPGDAVVECVDRTLDLRISAAMARVAAVLGVES